MRTPGDVDTWVDTVTEHVTQSDPARLRETLSEWPVYASAAGSMLRELLYQLPDELSAEPWHLAAIGATFHSVGSESRSAALPFFDLADASDRLPALPAVERADIDIHHGAALRTLGRFDEAGELLRRADSLLADPGGTPARRIVASRIRVAHESGMLAILTGHHDTARTQLRLAMGLADGALGEPEQVEALGGLAYLSYLDGEFAKAEERTAQASARAPHLLDSDFGVLHAIVRLLIATERGDHASSRELSLEVRGRSASGQWAALGHLALATVHLLDGGNVTGLDLLSRPTSHVPKANNGFSGHLRALRSVFLSRLNDLDTAQEVLAGVEPSAHHTLCPGRLRAALQLSSGDPEGCLETLGECFALGDTHSVRTLLGVLYLDAAARGALGDQIAADISFDRALLVAARMGIRNIATMVPPPGLQPLIARALDRNQPAAVHSLLTALRGGSWSRSGFALEPLSPRELEIVEQLSLQRTTDQIAKALYISANTVKTHVRSIYRKLDASNRVDALRRVHELGLVEITP